MVGIRRIFDLKGQQVIENWQKLSTCSEDLKALYLLPDVIRAVNLLKPTGYLMNDQFNIQQLYAVPTLYLCVLYLYENK